MESLQAWIPDTALLVLLARRLLSPKTENFFYKMRVDRTVSVCACKSEIETQNTREKNVGGNSEGKSRRLHVCAHPCPSVTPPPG